MAATDGQIILAASRFGDTPPLYLRDFSRQKLPAIAKIVKGQHQNLGVPTLAAPSLQSISLFLSAGKKYQILAQPIKIKEGRKPTNVGAKVLIPETYTGYFELLSEDGRSTRCIDSVLELSKRRNLRVLVRETFRCALMNRTIHAGEMLTTMNDNGKYLQCKNIRDEIINLPLELKAKFSPVAKEDSISGVHTVRNLLLKRMPVIVRLVHGNVPKGLKQPFVPELRLLGCVEMDRIFALPLQKDNDLVPVPLNAKIKLQRSKNMDQLEHLIEYSRILEKAQRLLTEARDRLQVVDLKLAADKERKDSKSRGANKLPVVMLPSAMGGYNAAGLMENGYVLRKSASCDSYSKSQAAAMLSSAEIADEYNEIDHIYDYVRGLTPLPKGLSRFEPISEAHTMKSYHTDSSGNYCSLIRGGTPAVAASGGAGVGASNNNNYSSLESSKGTGQHFSHHPTHQQQHPASHASHGHHQSASGAPVLVVAGPLVNHYHHSHIEEDIKPVPPPIETIPGKKLPEKRQRPTLPKLHLKNSHSSNSTSTNGNSSGNHHHGVLPQHGHHHPGGSPSASAAVNGHHHPQQPPPPSKILTPTNGNGPLSAAMLYKETASGHEPQSPLFHIRYKSLSSLQLTPDSNAPITPLISSNPKGQQQAQAQVLKSNMNAAVVAHHNHNNNNNNNNQAMLSKTASASIVVVGGKGGGDTGNHNNNHNPREGTLDSSRSGGRTSGDSNKLPEKKTRRLSRPRSLSNLVWDLRPSKEKSKKKLYIHHLDHRQQATLYL